MILDTVAQVEAEAARIQRRIAALQEDLCKLDARKAELAALHGDYGVLYVAPAIAFPQYWAVFVKGSGAWAVQTRTKRAACEAAEALLDRVPAYRWNPDNWPCPGLTPPDVLYATLEVRERYT